ncbi:sulfotransferase domain-containing protein [Parathermosynechococcus lividus]
MATLGEIRWHAIRWLGKRIMTLPSSKRHHLLIACMPKSGSTYLMAIIGHLPKMRIVRLVPGYDRREQELDISRLLAADGFNYVSQHHTRFSEPTKILLDRFCIHPIVLVRNIFDVVISIRDHLRNEGVVSPIAYINPEAIQWDDERLERFIVQMAIPWYFNFYLSWLDCNSKTLVRYEDLIRTPESVILSICDSASIQCNSEKITEAVQSAQQAFTRKNVGVAGRGQGLSHENRRMIYEMASYYTGIDFSPIGL